MESSLLPLYLPASEAALGVRQTVWHLTRPLLLANAKDIRHKHSPRCSELKPIHSAFCRHCRQASLPPNSSHRTLGLGGGKGGGIAAFCCKKIPKKAKQTPKNPATKKTPVNIIINKQNSLTCCLVVTSSSH